MPPWKLDSSYFSFGEWMRSSSRPKPTISESIPSSRLKSPTTGIEPPPPTRAGSIPHSSVSAARAPARYGPSKGSRVAPLPPWLVKVTRQSGGRWLVDEGPEIGADRFRILVADQPEGHLGRGLGRDHRLEALAGIAADDAVDLAGRPRPDLLQHRPPGLASRRRQPDRAEEFVGVEVERVPDRLDIGRNLRDPVIEIRDRHAPVRVVKPGENVREDVERIARRAAEHARVQVAVGGTDRHLLADQAAQHDGDGAALAAPHAGVADQRDVGAELVGIRLEEGDQARAARIPPRPRTGSRPSPAACRSPPSRPGRPRGRSSTVPCRPRSPCRRSAWRHRRSRCGDRTAASCHSLSGSTGWTS